MSIKSYSQTANFSKLSIGFGGGITTAYTGFTYGLSPSIPGFNPSKTFTINKDKYFSGIFDFYFSPFISVGIEYNNVTLKDGTDKYNRAFISKFNAIEFKGKLAAGQFINFQNTSFLYYARNINVSLGLGFINGTNNVADFGSGLFPRRQEVNDEGKSKFSSVLAIPASIGYFLNINDGYQEPKFAIGVDYKLIFTNSDDIDGYNLDPRFSANKSKDVYTAIGFSVKYFFGPQGLYYR